MSLRSRARRPIWTPPTTRRALDLAAVTPVDLRVTIDPSSTTIDVADSAQFTIRVENPTAAPAASATLTWRLGAGLTASSASSARRRHRSGGRRVDPRNTRRRRFRRAVVDRRGHGIECRGAPVVRGNRPPGRGCCDGPAFVGGVGDLFTA